MGERKVNKIINKTALIYNIQAQSHEFGELVGTSDLPKIMFNDGGGGEITSGDTCNPHPQPPVPTHVYYIRHNK